MRYFALFVALVIPAMNDVICTNLIDILVKSRRFRTVSSGTRRVKE